MKQYEKNTYLCYTVPTGHVSLVCQNGQVVPFLDLKHLTEFTFEVTSELTKTKAGPGGSLIGTNATATEMKATAKSASISPRMLAAMLGSNIEASSLVNPFYLTTTKVYTAAADGSITLDDVPARDLFVYPIDVNGVDTTVSQLNDLVVAGKKVSGTAMPAPLANQTLKYRVVYKREHTDENAVRIALQSQFKSAKFQLEMIGFFVGQEDKSEGWYDLKLYSAEVEPNFSLALSSSGDAATFDLVFNAVLNPAYGTELGEFVIVNEESLLGSETLNCATSDMPAPTTSTNKTALSAYILLRAPAYANAMIGGVYPGAEAPFIAAYDAAVITEADPAATQAQVDADLATMISTFDAMIV